jgi:putative membrane protein
MRRPLLLATAPVAALSVLAALSACERREKASAASGSAVPSAGSSQAPMPSASTAAGFLARAAMIDLFEVQSAQVALERTRNADVRRFAQQTAADHGRTSQELQALATAGQVAFAAPTRLDAPRAEMLTALRDAGPEAFDARYIEQQVEAHNNILPLLREYADNGDNPALQDWARRTAPTIENHLQMAQALGRGPAAAPAGAEQPAGQTSQP